MVKNVYKKYEFTMADNHVFVDYRLLEEIGRNVDKFQSDPLKSCTMKRRLPTVIFLFIVAIYNCNFIQTLALNAHIIFGNKNFDSKLN